MRILFLSNTYPPHSLGGYEQWCQEVAEELRSRGHEVQVLTSQPASGTVLEENVDYVHRILHLEVDGGLAQTIIRLLRDRQRVETENLNHLRKLVANYQPDLALIWGMWNVPRSVPALVEQLLSGRVAYFICDYWLTLPNAYIQRWQEDARHPALQMAKRLLGQLFLTWLERETTSTLALQHPICVSQAVRRRLIESGQLVEHAQVIYGGTQVDAFQVSRTRLFTKENEDLRIVFLGRLVADKGLHTVLDALHLILQQQDLPIYLEIYGSGDSSYEATLVEKVRTHNLQKHVTFQGKAPRTMIPEILSRNDVLVFPSEWEEPFARTVLEAMAAGLAVVGTTTGGTGEILVDGETGLTFPAGDASKLANQLCRLVSDRSLIEQLAKNGQSRVLEKHTLDKMVNEIEKTLLKLSLCEDRLCRKDKRVGRQLN